MPRLFERREQLATRIRTRHFEEAFQQREPQRPALAVGIGVPQKIDERADAAGAEDSGRREIDEPGEQRSLLVEEVALGRLSPARPLLDVGQEQIGLIAPVLRLSNCFREQRLTVAAKPLFVAIEPPCIRRLPVVVDSRRRQQLRRIDGPVVDRIHFAAGTESGHRAIERWRNHLLRRAVGAARSGQLADQIFPQPIEQVPARHTLSMIRLLQVGHARNDVEVGGGEAAGIARAAFHDPADDAFEVNRFVQFRAEALHGAGNGRQLARQARAPQVPLEKPHGLRTIRAERGARHKTERRIVFVDGRNQRILTDTGRERQVDPFEQLACPWRIGERQQLRGSHL